MVFVALLRGVNVVGANRCSMDALRGACEARGFRAVRTWVNSGNLVFEGRGTPRAVEARIEDAIRADLGLEVPVIVRTAARWAGYLKVPRALSVAARSSPDRVLLGLSKAPPREGALAALRERAAAGERIAVNGDAVWVHYPEGVGRSKITPALLDRAVGSPVTARNWNTVRALARLADSDVARANVSRGARGAGRAASSRRGSS
jgi:uncharacterized protein (DUF1697 family)